MLDENAVMRKSLLIFSWLMFCGMGNVNWAEEPANSLFGDWAFQFDPKDVGVKQQWFAKPLADKIQLPNSTATAHLGAETKNADKGMLTDLYKYIGPAWYQRDVDIPTAWQGRNIVLHLERVLWRSSVWVDDAPAGDPIDFLGIPHDHDLGALTPGRHTISIRVDNREIHAIGASGHHYYQGMQTIWNGIVGRIYIMPRQRVSLALVRYFPSYKEHAVGVEATVQNDTGKEIPRDVHITVIEKASGQLAGEDRFTVSVPPGRATVKRDLKLPTTVKPWDEFQPNLYTITTKLGSGEDADSYQADIGFRDLGKDQYHLTINGRPLFLRSNHDGCIFPLTGYPPTDVASWKRILQIYKDHGLNGIRFHSWTPPEEAFTAADELGIYIQSEHFWCRPDVNKDVESFCKQEMRGCLDRYGNHPSMCYVLYGNELGGDLKAMGDWLNADRLYDPRHEYSVAAGRRVPTADDFSEYGAKIDWVPNTDYDFSGYFEKYGHPGIPETTHELGQPATHPNWRELDKYTGILKPRNLELFRDAARAAGVEDQSADFQKASGNLNRISYKSDIEALLRTPQSAGYGLLDMHDYPGQGEALVGWLDSFYDEKGFLTAKEFHQYGSATVPLARLPKFVFTDGETLHAGAEIAHYGPLMLHSASLNWDLRSDDAKMRASGSLPAKDVPVGGITRFGAFACPLTASSPRGDHLKLELQIAGTTYANNWDIWVFPKPDVHPEPGDVLILNDPAQATKALDHGDKVLLIANRLGRKAQSVYATFKPPFWSAGYFGGEDSAVEGAVIQNHHPALALFPTDDMLDWQWQPLCADAMDYSQKPTAAWHISPASMFDDAHGFDLSRFPAAYRPIVQPVCDFHFPHKIGTVFELRTKTGGRLMVCGYNITGNLAVCPPARQLRASLLAYMASVQFNPDTQIDNEWILKTFEDVDKPVVMPAGFENAILYVKAGAHHPTGAGGVSWTADVDGVAPGKTAPGYTVTCGNVWAEPSGTAWTGTKIRIEIKVQAAVTGTLKVHFVDWNHASRRGIVRSVDDQQQILNAHDNAAGQWISFPIRREDCLGGKLFIEAEKTAGPNLMISEIALVP
jgi:hypothetical protein